ncbi:hypothetical protein R80B4_01742 [Fibrobacteres bacterium R8-0-B4]
MAVKKDMRDKPVTVGMLFDVITRFSENLERSLERSLDRNLADMSRRMAVSEAEYKKALAASDAKRAASEAEYKKALAASDAKIAASDAKIAASDAKLADAEAETKKMLSEANKRVKYLSNDCGSHGQGLGQLVEFIVAPGVRHAMNSLGHRFTSVAANKKIQAIIKGEKIRVAEVDLFLRNGTEAMAVEIKTDLTPEDVNKHLDRLAKLRKYEKEANIQGKGLYGAVVGLFVDDNARRFALKNGLYVLEIMEDENSLKTDKPPKCRVW